MRLGATEEIERRTMQLVAMLGDVRDAPWASRPDDAPHRRAGDRHVMAEHVEARAGGGGDADRAVFAKHAERAAVGLDDVGDRLEEPLEDAGWVQLDRDLLAESPHALEDA